MADTTSVNPTVPKPSGFMQNLTGGSGTVGGLPAAFQYQPAVETTTGIAQASPQNIASIVNATMQQLVGRFATDAEIKQYGAELLAAERVNPSTSTRVLTWDAATGKLSGSTKGSTSSGVDPSAFIASLINGTAEAKDYTAATGYFDAMKQSNDKFRSAFSA
jgi:hypothetical protein